MALIYGHLLLTLILSLVEALGDTVIYGHLLLTLMHILVTVCEIKIDFLILFSFFTLYTLTQRAENELSPPPLSPPNTIKRKSLNSDHQYLR